MVKLAFHTATRTANRLYCQHFASDTTRLLNPSCQSHRHQQITCPGQLITQSGLGSADGGTFSSPVEPCLPLKQHVARGRPRHSHVGYNYTTCCQLDIYSKCPRELTQNRHIMLVLVSWFPIVTHYSVNSSSCSSSNTSDMFTLLLRSPSFQRF